MTAPHESRHFGFRPGRLWSLWEMIKHDGAAFYFSTAALAMTRAALVRSGQPNDQVINRRDLGSIREGLATAKKHMPAGCNLAEMSIDRLLEKTGAKNQQITVSELNFSLTEIEGRIHDGLKQSYLFQLRPDEAALFYQKNPFGEKFAQQFAGAAYDVEEATKCLALDRSTASAFHSIRCLEAGIRALSRCLGIPDPTKAHERNWGKMLDALKAGMGGKWPTSTDRLTGDGEFFDNAYAALAAMQNPWRNATMHLDQKYTPDEARHIFDIVKGFMSRVASRMDENGEPKT